MSDHTELALLFLDVDGTVLPYGGAQLPTTPQGWDAWEDVTNPQLARIDLGHGPRLPALPRVLMWATAWMARANEVTAPLLGLPALPVAGLPQAPVEDEAGAPHWKTRTLVRLAAGRPFVWVDDEITDLDHAWVWATTRGAPCCTASTPGAVSRRPTSQRWRPGCARTGDGARSLPDAPCPSRRVAPHRRTVTVRQMSIPHCEFR